MDREIKFRAWDKKRNEMFWSGNIYLDLLNNTIFLDGLDYKAIDRFILMQYIGKTTVEGKRIYEGDVVEWYHSPYNPDNDEKSRAVIKWNNQEQRYTPFINITTEIIGNIYENPELIK